MYCINTDYLDFVYSFYLKFVALVAQIFPSNKIATKMELYINVQYG